MKLKADWVSRSRVKADSACFPPRSGCEGCSHADCATLTEANLTLDYRLLLCKSADGVLGLGVDHRDIKQPDVKFVPWRKKGTKVWYLPQHPFTRAGGLREVEFVVGKARTIAFLSEDEKDVLTEQLLLLSKSAYKLPHQGVHPNDDQKSALKRVYYSLTHLDKAIEKGPEHFHRVARPELAPLCAKIQDGVRVVRLPFGLAIKESRDGG